MPPNEHMADTVATKTILYFDHLYSLIHEFVKKKTIGIRSGQLKVSSRKQQ